MAISSACFPPLNHNCTQTVVSLPSFYRRSVTWNYCLVSLLHFNLLSCVAASLQLTALCRCFISTYCLVSLLHFNLLSCVAASLQLIVLCRCFTSTYCLVSLLHFNLQSCVAASLQPQTVLLTEAFPVDTGSYLISRYVSLDIERNRLPVG